MYVIFSYSLKYVHNLYVRCLIAVEVTNYFDTLHIYIDLFYYSEPVKSDQVSMTAVIERGLQSMVKWLNGAGNNL